jgi:hypothetical protein
MKARHLYYATFLLVGLGAFSAEAQLVSVPLNDGSMIHPEYFRGRQSGATDRAARGFRNGGLAIDARTNTYGDYGVELVYDASDLDVFVNLSEARGQTCSGMDASASAVVTMAGFNTTAYNPGNATNDVRAMVFFTRAGSALPTDPTVSVSYSLIKCTNATCSTSTLLTSGNLGSASLGTAAELRLTHVPASNYFSIKLNAAVPVYASYTEAGSFAAGLPAETLTVMGSVPAGCEATGFAQGRAIFSNLQVQTLPALASLYPDKPQSVKCSSAQVRASCHSHGKSQATKKPESRRTEG